MKTKNKIIIVAVSCTALAILMLALFQGDKTNNDAGSKPVFLFSRLFSQALRIDTAVFDIQRAIKEAPVRDAKGSKLANATVAFYGQNRMETKWMNARRPTKELAAFFSLVEASAQYGLEPDDYNVPGLQQRITRAYEEKATDDALIGLDIQTTMVFFQFCSDLTHGRTRAPENLRRTSTFDRWVAALHDSRSPRQLNRAIAELQPDHTQYRRLIEQLAIYRELAARDNARDASIPEGIAVIQPGDTSDALASIGRRLELTDQAYTYRDETVLSGEILAAVKRLQIRHDMPGDGTIGPGTLAILKTPFRDHAQLIALNLDRIRWLPSPVAERRIEVNIPDFGLALYEDNKRVMDMKVIVGDAYNRTPVFVDTVTYVVFGPTWTIPQGIIREEIIPKLRERPDVYSQVNFLFYKGDEEIDPEKEKWKKWDEEDIRQLRIVQRPGPDNPLGRVKFMMPNDLAIYLHDTPGDHLFNKDERAFSHGCIRLERPAELAHFLLRGASKWNSEKEIEEAMSGLDNQEVTLPEPIQVLLLYLTAWVDENGLLQFRKDIYDLDKRVDSDRPT